MTALSAWPSANRILRPARPVAAVAVLLLGAAACQPAPDPSKAEGDAGASPPAALTSESASGHTDSLAPASADTDLTPRRGRILDDGTIVTDTFEVRYGMNGENLTVSLETDLPDQTLLDVHVSRTYRKKGGTEDLPLDYFGEQSTVGAWRRPHTIRVDNAAWRTELGNVAAAGEPFEVAGLGRDIELSLTVPINQEAPYREGNENLRGSAVSLSTWGRIVRREIRIPYPIATAAAMARTQGGGLAR
jgi:hypothetical protein